MIFRWRKDNASFFTGKVSHIHETFFTSRETFRTSRETFFTSPETFRTSHDTFSTSRETSRTSRETFSTSPETFRTSRETFFTSPETFRTSQAIFHAFLTGKSISKMTEADSLSPLPPPVVTVGA